MAYVSLPILYYTILYSTIQKSTTLYYTILYYTILYYIILYPTICISQGAQVQGGGRLPTQPKWTLTGPDPIGPNSPEWPRLGRYLHLFLHVNMYLYIYVYICMYIYTHMHISLIGEPTLSPLGNSILGCPGASCCSFSGDAAKGFDPRQIPPTSTRILQKPSIQEGSFNHLY